MLNIIFQNMETSSADLERIEERARKELERPQSSPAHRTGARPKFGAMQISEDVEVSASESNTVGNVDSVAVDVVDSILVNLIHSAVSQAKAPRGKFGWCTACGSSAQHYCLQVCDEHCGWLIVMQNVIPCVPFLRVSAFCSLSLSLSLSILCTRCAMRRPKYRFARLSAREFTSTH